MRPCKGGCGERTTHLFCGLECELRWWRIKRLSESNIALSAILLPAFDRLVADTVNWYSHERA